MLSVARRSMNEIGLLECHIKRETLLFDEVPQGFHFKRLEHHENAAKL